MFNFGIRNFTIITNIMKPQKSSLNLLALLGILLATCQAAWAQQITVSGTVTDEGGEPLRSKCAC